MQISQNEFRQLIPILHPRTRLQDLDALRAWYEAVVDVLRLAIPADLLAFWMYDSEGVPHLVEPEALAADHLLIPYAMPLASQRELDQVEDRIRRAGYGSVLLRTIRHGEQDVGLLLLAAFAPHAHGDHAALLLETATAAMAPMLARVARSARESGPGGERRSGASAARRHEESAEWESDAEAGRDEVAASPGSIGPERDAEREMDLLGVLADAIGGAGTPRDLMLALSFALQPLLPHDCYELLIPDPDGHQHYRLGLHGHGALWADPALVWPEAVFDPAGLFAGRGTLLLEDAAMLDGVALPQLVAVRGPEVPPRALLGVRLRVVERATGYLLLGCGGPGLYRDEDVALLDRIGALLAPRVESLVLAWQYSVLRSQFDLLRHVPVHLARVAELLATTPFLGEGTRIFMQQAQAVLPARAIEFAVRLSDERRVAVVHPGVTTPLADLAQEPIDGTGVAQVVRGEVPYLLETEQEATGPVSVLVVPLRFGGKVIGAMALTGEGKEPFSRTDMALAQQLADLAAPHLELARRGSGPVSPFMPGWKRPTYRTERERNE